MKKLIFILITLFIPFFIFSQDLALDSHKPQVILFYSPHCKACLKLKEEFLPKMEEKYKERVEWIHLSVLDNKKNLSLLFSIAGRFKKKPSVPSVLLGDNFLVGREEIENNLENLIQKVLKEKKKKIFFSKVNLINVFNKLSVFTVMGSGLIDGINPCAFAVIVFFISFLAVYGYQKREVFIVGLFYCLAVFITYLLIGSSFFKFIYTLSGIYIFIKSFYYFVAVFCFLLAFFSFYDYLKFKKVKEATGLILQLPLFLKKRINLVIGSRLRERKERSVFSLIISSLVIGFLVSLLEAVCTGQVYLPIIVFILKNTNLRLRAFFYLILYNFMFILPLILVFLLSLLGFTSSKFNNFLKKNLGKVKVIMAILFLLLGIFILWIS